MGRKAVAMALALAAFVAAVSGCGKAVETAALTEAAEETAPEGHREGTGEAEESVDSETAALSGTSGAAETEEASAETEETAGGETAEEAGGAARERVRVKGIYVTGPMAGTSNMDALIDLVDRTELNALVIDVKNDEGRVVCEMDSPLVSEIGAVKRYVQDMPALVSKCREKGIYLIARIVAFKDPFLAEARPELSLHNADGTVFYDKDGLAWVNPYEPRVWEYLVEVAKGAVELGFDEVQFDYIRFSTDSGMKQVDFGPLAQEKSKEAVISEFTEYAARELHAMGAAVSADVYGVVIDSEIDQQIVGQDYLELCSVLDAISPMVYPSHYGPYNYDIPVPDAQPYDTVLAAMQASRKALAGLDPKLKGAETAQPQTVSGNGAGPDGEMAVSGNGAPVSGNDAAVSGNGIPVSGNDAAPEPEVIPFTAEEIASMEPLPEVTAAVRPWLQDFTATWVAGHIQYGPQQIREQIQAVYDAGYEEWILWNAANRYTEGGLYGPDGQPPEATAAGEAPARETAAQEAPVPETPVQETDGAPDPDVQNPEG